MNNLLFTTQKHTTTYYLLSKPRFILIYHEKNKNSKQQFDISQKCILLKHKTILLLSPIPMMIYHVNERKKEQALNLYFALLIPPLLSFY